MPRRDRPPKHLATQQQPLLAGAESGARGAFWSHKPIEEQAAFQRSSVEDTFPVEPGGGPVEPFRDGGLVILKR